MNRLVPGIGLAAAAILFIAIAMTPAPTLAAGASCSANPAAVVLGGNIQIVCDGFDPNVYVNSYTVDATGFAEAGYSDYSVCLVGARSDVSGSAKTNEVGQAMFTWYTQDGTSNCPYPKYYGFGNQLGKYTIVIQELDGKGGIVAVGKVEVTLLSNGNTYTGASLTADSPAISGRSMTIYGAGFVPNEYVNVWFTRPGDCSGMGAWYYSAWSAFDPEGWSGGGISGPSSVKTNESGSFTQAYALNGNGAYPCLGNWHVTVRAPGSGRGAEAAFLINGNAVNTTAQVWTLESQVPSYPSVQDRLGIGVHVYGSGFPAGSSVNCWFTRPDGTAYPDYGGMQSSRGISVGSDGTFSGFANSQTSEIVYQGEQPGTWAITCGTPDGKYVGIAHFLVYPLPLIDP